LLSGFFHLCRKAQHHLRGTRNIISSEARKSLPLAARMNDVALYANDVMLLINEVALAQTDTEPKIRPPKFPICS
jgi:hypothetical protein